MVILSVWVSALNEFHFMKASPETHKCPRLEHAALCTGDIANELWECSHSLGPGSPTPTPCNDYPKSNDHLTESSVRMNIPPVCMQSNGAGVTPKPSCVWVMPKIRTGRF